MAPRNSAQAQREAEQRERERQQREREAQRQREQAQREREQAQRERERAQREAQQAREREQAQRERERQQAQAQRQREEDSRRNQPMGVREAIRQAGEGGITKQEIQQIQKDTGTSMQKIIQQLDTVNKNLKEAEKQTIALNSGAANMLIKEASKATAFNQPNFGTGNIGQALAKAIGTPGYTAPRNPQSGGPYGGSTPGTPGTGFIPGGMQIRSGGRLAVRPQPTVAAPVAAPTQPTMSPEDIQTAIDQGIQTGINDYLGGLEDPYAAEDQAYLDMLNNLPDLFSQQMQGMFDPLQQAINSITPQEPMRLYGAGQNYNVGGVRSAMRRPQSRSNFLRNNMGIGGSATPGLTSSLSGLAGALGTLGGLTI